MPTACEVDAFYLGSVGPIAKLYAGTILVWPCFDCSTVDPEFANAVYTDALFYLPAVCTPQTPGAGYKVYDAVSDLILTQGPAYNGVYATSLAFETWGFNAPTTEDVGEILVEADLTAITGIVGVTTSAVSFYIQPSEEISVEDEGLLLKVQELSIFVKASVFFGTTIQASVPNPTELDPDNLLEVIADTDLIVDTETKVIVEYNLTETSKKLSIYYGISLVGEIEEPI